ncbi:formate dehydrogenase accessory sulfurtransferase FdhD [Desertihabitans aurantiacus]|uniref:formate dehydrogenase accessory sulfurtransferase FdhD n=1 Tax=Desertihabitans aurantiacus TaxID=2282477 RepID=UPI000DF7F132|nr:formate dehydrogenase accessory sulfurtransferase FdhD [Desertihabitans aurantiacus]
MVRATTRRRVRRLGLDGTDRSGPDTLAGEQPLEIALSGEPWVVTMRTPGHDFDLVLGLLHAEGIVVDAAEVATMSYRGGVDPDGSRSFNHLDARLAPGVRRPASTERAVYTSSSCGACGTASMEAVTKLSRFDVAADPVSAPLAEVLGWTDRLREAQQMFDRTGGVHAAGLFRIGSDGSSELLCVREDVGRHNAVDKIIGWALREGMLPLNGCALQLSGRVSFELVQKAHLAGIPLVAAVSAPSSLAVEHAEESGVTVVGFSRGRSCNVYSRPERITTG